MIQTPENNNNLKERYEYASIWFVDPNTMNPEDNANIYNQLFLVSLTAQTMYVAFNTLKGLVSKFYYIFEDTNAFVAYPFKSYWENNKTNSFLNYNENPSWCTDNYGNIVNYYKFKCRTYYIDIKKTSTTISFIFSLYNFKKINLYIIKDIILRKKYLIIIHYIRIIGKFLLLQNIHLFQLENLVNLLCV